MSPPESAGSVDSADLPESLTAEVANGVLRLTITRAHKRNAIDSPTLLGLERVFTTLDASVRCVILHGDGPHFCAGLDLNEVSDRDTIGGLHFSRMWHRVFQTIEFGTVPVVSVLRGATIGAGLELASSTHVRIAESTTFYALPEGQRGIFVGGGGSVRIPRLIGTSRMMEMMLTGHRYNADEGLALGLSHYVVDDGAGMALAEQLAAQIASNEPFTNFAIVNALPRIAEAEPATGYLLEAAIGGAAQSTDSAKARVQEFLTRKPKPSSG